MKKIAESKEEFISLSSKPDQFEITNSDMARKILTKRFQHKLDKGNIDSFIQSLEFKNHGLSHGRYDMIENKLTTDEFNSLFESFGISNGLLDDYRNMYCEGPGTCAGKTSHICTGNCYAR